MKTTMHDPEKLIDAALDSYPVYPVPPGFTNRVMAQIVAKPVRFRLEFLDFILPAFFALFAGAGFAAILAIMILPDPLWLLRLQLELQPLLWQLPEIRFSSLALFASLGVLALFFGLGVAVLLFPPRLRFRWNV